MSLSTAEWIAIGAAVVAAAAAVVAVVAWSKLRAVRGSQLVLLGGGKADLVGFDRAARCRADGCRRQRDPRARLRPHLRQGARAGASVRRPVAGRAGGRGTRNEQVKAVLVAKFRPRCSKFSF